jgi:undecaprenyl-diphosphatase
MLAAALVGFVAFAGAMPARAGCGLFGIDHKVQFDDSGIWARSNQRVVEAGTVLAVVGGALWEGSESRRAGPSGDRPTRWRSVRSAPKS